MLDPNKRIIGKQVYLRPITDSEEDTNNIIRWRNSETVRPYFIYQKPFTVEGHKKWLETEIFSGKGFQFIVHRIEDGMAIGCAYFRDYDKECRKAEYGMYIGEEIEKGKGIGTEMMELSTRFGFEELNLHKIYSRILADNKASFYSTQKNGYEKEAYLKDEVMLNGEYKDVILVGKINPKEVTK